MSLIEFIGFMISILALSVITARRAAQERLNQKESWEEEEGGDPSPSISPEMVSVYQELGIQLPVAHKPQTKPKEIKAPPPPQTHRTVGNQFKFKSQIENRKRVNPIANRDYHNEIKRVNPIADRNYHNDLEEPEFHHSTVVSRPLRAKVAEQAIKMRKTSSIYKAFRKISPKRDIVLYREILNPPKALKERSDDPWKQITKRY